MTTLALSLRYEVGVRQSMAKKMEFRGHAEWRVLGASVKSPNFQAYGCELELSVDSGIPNILWIFPAPISHIILI
jgi:hypothetical protein